MIEYTEVGCGKRKEGGRMVVLKYQRNIVVVQND